MQKEKSAKTHMEDIHFEHKVWQGQLKFCKDEIEIFKNRLEEVVQRYTDKDVLKRVEHFQNQFIIQRDHIDRFLHDITVHEDELAKEAISNPVAVDRRLMDDHPEERERFDTFVNLYNEMKKDYMVFLRRWM